ncbi:MAG: thioredoxin family protein [Bacteroidetes bacterium]|nr:thioredoxin family protein [Bacteroidota bacterium]
MKKIVALLTALLTFLPASAQKTTDIVKFTPGKATINPEGRVSLRVQAEILPGWHLYSTKLADGGPVATSFSLPDGGSLVSVSESSPESAYDPNFEMQVAWFKESATFDLIIKPGSQTGNLNLQIRFMACNDNVCAPPAKINLSISYPVREGTPAATEKTALVPAAFIPDTVKKTEIPATGQEPVLAGTTTDGLSLWAFIWLAMSVGALTLLTPCVFPMIPITVSYFTKRQEKTSGTAIRDSVIFMTGIVLTFTLLGFFLAVLFGAAGITNFSTNPWINLAVGLLFVFFALNLFGLFEIGLPASLQTRLTLASSGGGITGIILMALTFTVTSFTCTMPFVGTILVSASQGDWFFPVVGMLAFSFVFSIPFFFLSLFPSWMNRLPKSGNWMLSVKVLMGFLEIAAAFKFFSNADLVYQWEILTRDRFLAVWAAISLASALYLFGVFRLAHEAEDTGGKSPVRILIGIFFLYLTFDFTAGIFGKRLGELDAFMPPQDYGRTQFVTGGVSAGNPETVKQGPVWLSSLEEGKKASAQSGKPIFIDFTGYTCTNCRWMEQNIFTRPEISALLNDFVLVKLYTDGDGAVYEANQAFQEAKFGTVALPLYAVLTPEEKILGKFEGMTRNPAEYESFLKSVLQK